MGDLCTFWGGTYHVLGIYKSVQSTRALFYFKLCFLHVCSQVEVDVWGSAAAGSALNP